MDIDKLSQLARIKLDKKERDDLARELESILGYVDKLKKVNVSNVPELTHPSDVYNVFRESGAQKESSEDANKLVEAAPEMKRGFVKVRGVFNKN